MPDWDLVCGMPSDSDDGYVIQEEMDSQGFRPTEYSISNVGTTTSHRECTASTYYAPSYCVVYYNEIVVKSKNSYLFQIGNKRVWFPLKVLKNLEENKFKCQKWLVLEKLKEGLDITMVDL